MLHTGVAGLEHQFGGDLHGLQPEHRHTGQHLNHDPVAAIAFQQGGLQAAQRFGQVEKRRPIAQCAGLALEQWQVMPPFITNPPAIEQAIMGRHPEVIGIGFDPPRILAHTDLVVRVLARYRIPVAIRRDQAGAGNPCDEFNIAVEDTGHRHQMRLFEVQRLGDRQRRTVRVSELLPQGTTAAFQPCVEFIQTAELSLTGFLPQPLTAVLNVLLDLAFLPTRRDIAEFRVEQIMRRHHAEAGVDDPRLPLADLVHRRFHIVVDASPRHPAKSTKCPCVGVEQHFLALGRIGYEEEGTAGTQLGV
jgi:hypothetical protein